MKGAGPMVTTATALGIDVNNNKQTVLLMKLMAED